MTIVRPLRAAQARFLTNTHTNTHMFLETHGTGNRYERKTGLIDGNFQRIFLPMILTLF